MKRELIDILETICPSNVYLQGTFAEDIPYPANFITFWTDSTEDDAFYNNDASREIWRFTVIFYSNDPTQVDVMPAEIRARLKNAGFIPQGKGMDIPSDEPTHTGWAMDFIKVEHL